MLSISSARTAEAIREEDQFWRPNAPRRERSSAKDRQNRVVSTLNAAFQKADAAVDTANNHLVQLVSSENRHFHLRCVGSWHKSKVHRGVCAVGGPRALTAIFMNIY